ncbi:MAG: helix-turn-helix domain-containing protein [Roseomonas sp.]|nr:helix-turn-helix domain-containing protein [Roseomonas sp.]
MSHDRNGHAHDLSRAQVIALLEERDTLRETIRRYEELLKPTVLLPRSWRLTGSETQLLLAIRAVGLNVLHKERAFIAMYGMFDDDAPDMKTLDVFICKLRRKLMEAQTRISIQTVWGRGWCLDADSLTRLNDAVAAFANSGWQPGTPLEITPAATVARRYG